MSLDASSDFEVDPVSEPDQSRVSVPRVSLGTHNDQCVTGRIHLGRQSPFYASNVVAVDFFRSAVVEREIEPRVGVPSLQKMLVPSIVVPIEADENDCHG